MNLGRKIVLLLTASILGALTLTTSYELISLSEQFAGENRKQHQIILTNLASNLTGALYNIDSALITRQIETTFMMGDIQSIVVFDESGKLLEAHRQPEQRRNDHSSEKFEVSKKELGLADDALMSPLHPYDTNPLLHIQQSSHEGDYEERLIATLWYDTGDQHQFVGHAVLDYGCTSVKKAVIVAALKKIASALLLASIILIFSFVFLKVGVITRLEQLKKAVGRIKERDYTVPIEVKGSDEISELGEAFKIMVREIASYQQDLEEKVRARTRELQQSRDKVKLILDSIEQGIMTLDHDLIVGDDYSRYTMTILSGAHWDSAANIDRSISKSDQRKSPETAYNWTPAGKSVIELVFKNSNMSNDELSQLQSSLFASVGEPLLSFELNEHCLPREIVRSTGDAKQILDLSWVPIVEEGDRVQKILFAMRDVTELHELEEESRRNREEIELISEIANAPADYYQRFVTHAAELLGDSRKLVENEAEHSDCSNMLRLLFINMHTLKGEARALGLKRFTSVVHLAEEVYDKMRKDTHEQVTQEKLASGINDAENVLGVYTSIAETKLGRKANATAATVSVEQLETINQLIIASQQDPSLQSSAPIFKKISDILTPALYESSRDLFNNIFAFAPRLARELGKEPPNIDICGTENIFLTPRAASALHKAFTHLIRNSLDHGLEPADERKLNGKPGHGSLKLKISSTDGCLNLLYSDDGRGLPLEALKQKALSLHLLQESDLECTHKVAQIILHHGVSTAEKITDISGRGVGVGAVQLLIAQIGGEFDIVIPEVPADHKTCPITFRIKLPVTTFLRAGDSAAA